MSTFDKANDTAARAWARRAGHPYYCRARAYCDEHGLEREDQLLSVMHEMAFKEYKEFSKPYIDIKIRYANFSMKMPPEVESTIDEILKMLAKSCGLEVKS